eukprot:SAG22_NODE_16966_length_314_cov_0.418605_1_plen_39_part_01
MWNSVLRSGGVRGVRGACLASAQKITIRARNITVQGRRV